MLWKPKYRKRILIGKIAASVKQLMYQACNANRWMLSEMNVQENHGTYCTGKPALKCCGGRKKVKGRHTSKRIGSEFPELEEFLWEIAL